MLIDIYAGLDPTSAAPRNVSAILAIAAVYGLFAFVCELSFKFFVGDQLLQETDTNGS